MASVIIALTEASERTELALAGLISSDLAESTVFGWLSFRLIW